MNQATKEPTPEPGIYSGIEDSEYFRWKAVSNSRLGPLRKSPLHCRYAMDHPSEPTDALILGSAVDCLVFTPKDFNSKFVTPGQCEATTQKGKQCSNQALRLQESGWSCGVHASGPELNARRILTKEQGETACAMAKAVHDHPGASVLLAACEELQLSLVWRENNLTCKGRLDGLASGLRTIIDLKTTVDASPDYFSRKIFDYGYHRQAAMYMRGATACGIEVEHFAIVAVENAPPHAVAVYRLENSAVEIGNTELLRLLDKYEHCEATGVWPGYSEEPLAIGVPKWAVSY